MLSFGRLSRGHIVGLAIVVVGVLLLVLAYSAQSRINEIGSTNDPKLQDRVAMLENERGLYLVTALGALFTGLFAFALLGESSMSTLVPQSEMISSAKIARDTIRGLSLSGNACYLPSRHGLTHERVLIQSASVQPNLPKALSDDLVMSPGSDGSTPGMLLEPLGLSLLDRTENELATKIEGSGLEAEEGTLQVLKHGFGMMKDFHFKERDGKVILRVEYSKLLEACRSVRKEMPDTCRQFECVGCSCLLTATARATGKAVFVESVDNGSDQVVFTLVLKEW